MTERRRAHALLLTAPLLMTESQDKFDRIRAAFDSEIKPLGIIDEVHVFDIAHITWEILRMRRCKAVFLNSAFLGALGSLLEDLWAPVEYPRDASQEAKDLAYAWFSDPAAKKRVSELLRRYQLDESAIEAEVVMNCRDDIEQIERLLASLESRRDRALRGIAEYRTGLARQLRNFSDQILEDEVIAQEGPSSEDPAAAA
jgi:hypothetical protein